MSPNRTSFLVRSLAHIVPVLVPVLLPALPLLVLPLAACAPSEETKETGGSSGTGTGGSTTSGSGGATTTGSGGASTTGSGGATSSGGSTGTGTGGTSATGGASGTGGRGTGGATATGGTTGTGGRATGGATGTGGTTGSGGATASGGAGGATTTYFSFFLTSVGALKRLSNNANGFGGDLRYGEATGLAGADKICTEIAETSLPGSGAKGWRAFLSTTTGGPNDGPVNAIDRIGEGPWYDRKGRVLALTKTALNNTRPQGADPTIANDFPNEDGVPNHSDGSPGCTGNACPDNHDILTGTGTTGALFSTDWKFTCHDWTSVVGTDGTPHCGHSWPRGVQSWMSVLNESGCEPGIFLVESGGPGANKTKSVGDGGGYGGFYCFALKP